MQLKKKLYTLETFLYFSYNIKKIIGILNLYTSFKDISCEIAKCNFFSNIDDSDPNFSFLKKFKNYIIKRDQLSLISDLKFSSIKKIDKHYLLDDYINTMKSFFDKQSFLLENEKI